MMCGIDQAIQHIREDCSGLFWMQQVINRLEYHRKQAIGIKPKYHNGQSIRNYYTCGNCGKMVEIQDNFCAGCGFRIMWDNIRCLTGLPLVDAAERSENDV